MEQTNKYLNLLLTILLSTIIGGLIMLFLGHNPIEAYIQLLRGAFVGKLNFGTTLQKFVPLLLTSMAFLVASRVGVFNVGVDGELYLGAIAAAWVGFTFTTIPGPILVLMCLAIAAIVGAAWAYIPGSLKAYLGVNEICVTILMNYVATYITSYLVNGPLSAKTGVPQTPTIAKGAQLTKILKPSQANTGLFIALAIVAIIYWILQNTTIGYRFKSVGLNPMHAEYVGISPKKTIINSMLLSGAIGGLAGAIEVLGVYGYFLDGFSSGVGFDGMLVVLMVKGDMKMVPFVAFFIAALKAGALGMERYTGLPKSIVDTIIAIFIIFATMENLFSLYKKKRIKAAQASVSERD